MKDFKEMAIAVVIVLAVALVLSLADKSQQLKGGEKDSHGCYVAAGYSWCEASGKCIRIWEEYCDTATLEKLAQGYCGGENVAKVYVCGDRIRTVSSLLGGGSTFIKPGTEDVRCPVVGPDSMSDECRQLLLGSNCVEKEIC
jgi:hypothetical protein